MTNDFATQQPSRICLVFGIGFALIGSLVLAGIFGTGYSFGMVLHLLLAALVGYILAVRCAENGNELFGLVSFFYLPQGPRGALPRFPGQRTTSVPYGARPPEALKAPAGAGSALDARWEATQRTTPAMVRRAPWQPQLVSPSQAEERDDLKEIKGIGPKLESVLNDLGIYRHEQIAAWTPEELAEVDEKLGSFKGQPERGDWVGQARALMAQRKG